MMTIPIDGKAFAGHGPRLATASMKLSRVLVVSRKAEQRERVTAWLRSAGHDARGADDFQVARRELERDAPDVLIADVKLDAYNGIHLAILGRGRGLPTRVILVGDADDVLRRDAERQRALYLTTPLDAPRLLASVVRVVSSCAPARRSERKRVSLQATIDGVPVSIIDLSYEGIGLEIVQSPAGIPPPLFFTLQMPAHGLSLRVRRAWVRWSPDTHRALRCGAAFPDPQCASAERWRQLVDSTPGLAYASAGLTR